MINYIKFLLFKFKIKFYYLNAKNSFIFYIDRLIYYTYGESLAPDDFFDILNITINDYIKHKKQCIYRAEKWIHFQNKALYQYKAQEYIQRCKESIEIYGLLQSLIFSQSPIPENWYEQLISEKPLISNLRDSPSKPAIRLFICMDVMVKFGIYFPINLPISAYLIYHGYSVTHSLIIISVIVFGLIPIQSILHNYFSHYIYVTPKSLRNKFIAPPAQRRYAKYDGSIDPKV